MADVSINRNEVLDLEKGNNVFRLLHQNVQYLSNKVQSFENFVNEIKSDFIVVTEHGLNIEQLSICKLNNYTLVDSFCREGHKSGGVALFINNIWKANSKNVKAFSKEMTFEVAAAQIEFGNQTIMVLGIYRSPSSNILQFLDHLDNLLCRIVKLKTKIIIMGDLNIDLDFDNDNYKKLSEIFHIHNIRDTIFAPTRETHNKCSIIDHIITNLDDSNFMVGNINNFLSDHFAQYMDIKDVKIDSYKEKRTYRITNKESVTHLNILLSQETWKDVFESCSINDKWEKFYNIFNIYFNQCCPIVTKIFKNKLSSRVSLPEETIDIRNKMKEMHLLYKSTSHSYYKTQYKYYKKTYESSLKSLKSQTIELKLQESNNISKTAWDIINSVRKENKRKSDNVCLKVNGRIEYNPTVISNTFNNYFLNIAKTITQNSPSVTGNRPNDDFNCSSIYLHATSKKEILDIIRVLKSTKSSGWDGISTVLLKQCMEVLVEPLVYLINESILAGVFPNCLKISTVIPLYKKGDKLDVNNYRPITLTLVFAKVLRI